MAGQQVLINTSALLRDLQILITERNRYRAALDRIAAQHVIGYDAVVAHARNTLFPP